MNADLALCVIAAANSVNANFVTLTLAQLFGEKKTLTDEHGTVTVAKWRGEYYMLDYEPAPDARQTGETIG